MLTSASSPVYSYLQPRHASRRERTPGARERHSTQLERMSPESRFTHTTRPKTAEPKSSFCMQSGVTFSGQQSGSRQCIEPEVTTTNYQELSTIGDIRAEMRATEKRKPKSIPAHIPQWMLDLDINLDVSSADIIPPFEDQISGTDESFRGATKVTIVYDSDSDNDDDVDSLPSEETFPEFEHSRRLQKLTDSLRTQESTKCRQPAWRVADKSPVRRAMSSLSQRPMDDNGQFNKTGESPRGKMSSSLVIRGRDQDTNPCRYQGDMKVMSMQRGGIRSTPMQPKSKKFINQMLTYRQMKIHSMKMQAVKPAVDTKMPKSFKLAIERKRQVEQQHSSSLDQSYDTSARSSPSPATSRSYAKVR